MWEGHDTKSKTNKQYQAFKEWKRDEIKTTPNHCRSKKIAIEVIKISRKLLIKLMPPIHGKERERESVSQLVYSEGCEREGKLETKKPCVTLYYISIFYNYTQKTMKVSFINFLLYILR